MPLLLVAAALAGGFFLGQKQGKSGPQNWPASTFGLAGQPKPVGPPGTLVMLREVPRGGLAGADVFVLVTNPLGAGSVIGVVMQDAAGAPSLIQLGDQVSFLPASVIGAGDLSDLQF